MNSLAAWLRQPFQLLDTVQARWKLILFCGVFNFLFLNIFKPFNINQWFKDASAPLVVVLTLFSVAGMVALTLSQFGLRSLFNLQLTTRIGFLVWLLVDIFFISIAVHTIDILFLKLSFFDFAEYLENLKHTVLVLALPYFIGILLLFVQQQLEVVKELTLKVSKPVNPVESVTITDENGKVAMNVPMRNIVYFKSEDNYIQVYYKSENELKKELIRTNLKKLEQELNQPNLIRIHRSYMINSQNLLSAVKTSRGYKVKMEVESKHHLPVSATYQSAFEEKVVQL